MPAPSMSPLTPVQVGGDGFPVARVTAPDGLGGAAAVPTASFARPADTTAYAAGDLVANSTTAGSAVPLSFAAGRVSGGSVLIPRARLRKSGTGTTNASFRLHLYTQVPVPSNGDNGAWLTPAAGYAGSIDATVDKAFTDGSRGEGVPATGSYLVAVLPGTTLYGLLEARAAYTPASGEQFTVELEVLQN